MHILSPLKHNKQLLLLHFVIHLQDLKLVFGHMDGSKQWKDGKVELKVEIDIYYFQELKRQYLLYYES